MRYYNNINNNIILEFYLTYQCKYVIFIDQTVYLFRYASIYVVIYI